MNILNFKIYVFALLALSVTVLCLTSCGLMRTPASERLKNIEPIMEVINPTTIGKIVEEEWYPGDGFAGGSSYQVKFQGKEPFEKIAEKIKYLEGFECEIISVQIVCSNKKGITIAATTESGYTNLQIRDTFGGSK